MLTDFCSISFCDLGISFKRVGQRIHSGKIAVARTWLRNGENSQTGCEKWEEGDPGLNNQRKDVIPQDGDDTRGREVPRDDKKYKGV